MALSPFATSIRGRLGRPRLEWAGCSKRGNGQRRATFLRWEEDIPLEMIYKVYPLKGMRTKVARWGNSLALRIPRKLALSHHLDEGSSVEIIEDQGELKLRPVSEKAYSLDELLDAITGKNLHEEMQTGSARGKEVW
jgi:antitoxin MazE